MFSIDVFATRCTTAMAESQDRQSAAAAVLSDAIATYGPDAIIEGLNAAVPPGASVGELIVHASPELTMLFARIPAHFQSGIHNHTVFACIGQLKGREINTTYEEHEGRLRMSERQVAELGTVLQLPADAIHGIANPGSETAFALHLYGGDLAGLQEERSLWDEDSHQEVGFSFPALVQQSVKAMKKSDNDAGLRALVTAIPAAQAAVDAA